MPQTRYVDGDIAYQVVGEGPLVLVANWGFISNIETFHDVPGYTSFVERLGDTARVVTFDVRGMGASRGRPAASLDERLEDLVAVVDAVSSDSVALLGTSSGGALAIAFAAAFPDRTHSLALFGAYPRFLATDELPMVTPPLLKGIEAGMRRIGRGVFVEAVAPSLAVTPVGRDRWKLVEASVADPEAMSRHLDTESTIDVTSQLGSVDAPTLVMHRVNEQFVPPQVARYLSARIRTSELVLMDGLDHAPWLGKWQEVSTAITSFLSGRIERPQPMRAVLLTDIVRSTELVIAHGDAKWDELLVEHNRIADATVTDLRGIAVKTTGDGMVAVFDEVADAMRCAIQLRNALSGIGLDIRGGVTVGDVIVRSGDVTGVAVHIAERIAKLAGPGQIYVSRGAYMVLPEAQLDFVGLRALRGVPGDRSVFELR